MALDNLAKPNGLSSKTLMIGSSAVLPLAENNSSRLGHDRANLPVRHMSVILFTPHRNPPLQPLLGTPQRTAILGGRKTPRAAQ
jgi:hypothetical protein